MEQSTLWVEDSLHDILGLSDDKTVQYLTSMASQASFRQAQIGVVGVRIPTEFRGQRQVHREATQPVQQGCAPAKTNEPNAARGAAEGKRNVDTEQVLDVARQ